MESEAVSTPPSRRRAVAALLLLTSGVAGALVGGLMLLVGSGALLPAGPLGTGVPLLLLLVGTVAALLSLPAGGAGFPGWVGRKVPRMYPFAPPWLNAAIFVTLVIGATSIFHGMFDVMSGAHNGGQVGTLSDQDDLAYLLIGGSVVVWILTTYTVVVFARVIRIGRALDASAGTDAYGRSLPAVELPRIPPQARPSLAPERGDGMAIVAVSLILLVGASAGTQVLEVNISPAPVGEWLVSLLVLPLWAVVVGSALAQIDRGIRGLERRHHEALRHAAAPVGSRRADETSPVPGFVH